MRCFLAVTLGSLLTMGCGNDDNGTGGTGGTGGTAGTGGAGGVGGGGTPLVVEVVWAPQGECEPGTRSDYGVDVTVVSGTEPFTIEGSVTGCEPGLTMETNTISCPNAAAYGGMVTVTDGADAMTTVSFTIDVCESGSAP